MDMSSDRGDTRPLYVRLPEATARRLDKAAAARGSSKRQLVTELIGSGLLARPQSIEYGHASVISTAIDILTLEEAAELLRVEASDLRALAESGQLPARRIGDAWRLSRAALLAWLGADDTAAGGGMHGRRGGTVGFSIGSAAGTDAAPEAHDRTEQP
jgi:excisionase family DNA binding protein